MEVLMKDLYCYECSMQFYNENLFNIHLSFVHGKELEIKQDPKSEPLVIPETKEHGIKYPDKENNSKKRTFLY